MLAIYCPHCADTRNESEYHHAGEAFIVRPANPDSISDEAWGDYLFHRKNPKDWVWEQWVHGAGCRKVLVVKRHNVTNAIAASYTLNEAKRAWREEEA